LPRHISTEGTYVFLGKYEGWLSVRWIKIGSYEHQREITSRKGHNMGKVSVLEDEQNNGKLRVLSIKGLV